MSDESELEEGPTPEEFEAVCQFIDLAQEISNETDLNDGQVMMSMIIALAVCAKALMQQADWDMSLDEVRQVLTGQLSAALSNVETHRVLKTN